jgi:hypothetical protein
MENLFPKLLEEQQNELYKFMCNMLEALTKEDFNKVYERFKATYTNDVGVLKYTLLDGQWKRDGQEMGVYGD